MLEPFKVLRQAFILFQRCFDLVQIFGWIGCELKVKDPCIKIRLSALLAWHLFASLKLFLILCAFVKILSCLGLKLFLLALIYLFKHS